MISAQGGLTPIPDERRRVFFGLFVFPMLIAVTMAVLLSSIVLLTREDDTPESLIAAIKSGSPSKRWQKAFELSNELNREGGLIRSAGIMQEIVHILNDKTHYDGKTRAYMAMALSRFENSEARAALLEALKGASDSDDPRVPLFILWALGNAAQDDFLSQTAAGEVARFLKSEHADLRKTAAYVLGAFESREAVLQLNALLEDPVEDVRWNAALALARLGESAGLQTLLEMTDRSYLEKIEGMSESQLEQVMVNGAKGLGLISETISDSAEIIQTLNSLSETDSSLKVREAAREATQLYHVKSHV